MKPRSMKARSHHVTVAGALTCWLAMTAGAPAARGAGAVLLAPAPAPTTAAPGPNPASPAPPRRPPSRFRMGLAYTRVLSEDGDLAVPDMTTNAIGVDLIFPSSSYSRDRITLAHQWEHQGAYSARGFRIDLVSMGYPIHLVEVPFRLDLEPILNLVRGELMWVEGGPRTLRMESGFGLEMSATVQRWFFAVRPLEVDFRYWIYSTVASTTGFARLFPFRVAVGYEF